MAAKSYHQLFEGDWVPVLKRGHKHACCDCGLTHRFQFRIDAGGGIEIKAKVDRRATAAIRRPFKFERDD
jgi:hypothetical protein